MGICPNGNGSYQFERSPPLCQAAQPSPAFLSDLGASRLPFVLFFPPQKYHG